MRNKRIDSSSSSNESSTSSESVDNRKRFDKSGKE